MIRAVRWPADSLALRALDTSFRADRVYRLEQGEFTFGLVEEAVTPPLTKLLPAITDEIDELMKTEHVVVAEAEGELIGVAAAQHSEWNNRVELRHLYVHSRHRRSGVGTALLESVFTYARAVSARCVWLETQNVNYPAIQFYRSRGFRLAGLDACLYDPRRVGKNEVALFFAKMVEGLDPH